MSVIKTIDHQIEKPDQEAIQKELLKEQLDHISENSKFYGAKQFISDDVWSSHSLSEIMALLPITSKDDIAQNDKDFYCADISKIVDFSTTSGTTGNPVSFALTKKDISRLAINEKYSFQKLGLSNRDTIQLMTTIDKQFMAGLAYYLGAVELGAVMTRIGPGAALQQWDAILKYQPSTLICIPSFVPILIDFARENKIPYQTSSVKNILCIGEPIRQSDFSLNALGQKIKSMWDVSLYSTYASTEMGMSFTECEIHQGGHLNPELGIIEVLDENGYQVSNGEFGEVVVTNLQVEGTPLIRFKTGDICQYYTDPCSCGRKTPRLGPVIGRKQQMLKFKGTTIFPAAIFEVLDHFKFITLYQVIVTTNEFRNNHIEILLSEDEISSDQLKIIQSQCKIKLKVTPQINLIGHNKLEQLIYPDDSRKPKKILYL